MSHSPSRQSKVERLDKSRSTSRTSVNIQFPERPRPIRLLVRDVFGDRGEHAFEKYDSRWEPMCGISIPGNINDRAAIGTRNKSNGACSSRQWSRASCILPSFPLSYGCTIGTAQCRDPIPFILLPLSTVYFRQQQQEPLYRSTRTYTLTKSGDTSGAFTKQNLRRPCARAQQKNLRKSWAISPLTPRSTAKNFSLGLVDISRVLLAYSEMESIYNFANGHSVLPLATLRYHSRKVYLFVETQYSSCKKNVI